MRNRIATQVVFGLILIGVLIVCSISIYGQLIGSGIANQITKLVAGIVSVVVMGVVLKMLFSSMDSQN